MALCERHYRSHQPPFPAPMTDAAFHGVTATINGILESKTEASRESILLQFLIACGNLLGRNAVLKHGGLIYPHDFLVLVGETAFGRKGTAWTTVRDLMTAVAPEWATKRILTRVVSGEAIVYAVRDAVSSTSPSGKTYYTAGVDDKRLVIFEQEFGHFLSIGNRQDNTLLSTIRYCWDAPPVLHTTAKHNPDQATGAHVSLIAHITPEELKTKLARGEIEGGTANRFLWCAAVRRAERLPFPVWIDWAKQSEITAAFDTIYLTFSSPKEMDLDAAARALWVKFHAEQKPVCGQLMQKVLARELDHVLKLAMIYAALDATVEISADHLCAALAVWDYCRRSAIWIFGEKTGSCDADRLLWTLERRPEGMTRSEISIEVFSRHAPPVRIDQALTLLNEAGVVRMTVERGTNNKLVERWFSTR